MRKVQWPSGEKYKSLRGWSFVTDPIVSQASLHSRLHPLEHRGSNVRFPCVCLTVNREWDSLT
jgi:hypothetical protein